MRRGPTRCSKLKPNDALVKRLKTASSQVDDLRKKIVATKEGGMITGEERLREFLTELYGNVVFYEGRPSEAQTMRADALSRGACAPRRHKLTTFGKRSWPPRKAA